MDEDFGYTGEIKEVNSHLIDCVIREGFIPVVATIGTDRNAQSFNINADTAAGEVSTNLSDF